MPIATPIDIKRVSVVIPARNRASVIGRAIESAKAQTMLPVEIIVIDDGSDDAGATVAVARAQNSAVVPVRIIELDKRGGAPRARNAGVKAALGEWIALLDSDDAWTPEKLSEQLALAGPGVCAVFTDTLFEHSDGKVTTKFAGMPGDPADLIFTNSLGGCSVALIERNAFLAVGGFDESLPSCQDWDLWIKLRDHGELRVSPKPLTRYFFDGGERISRNVAAILAGHQALFDRLARRSDVGDAAALRRYQRFHLAQTKVYFAGTSAGILEPALSNFVRPHPRTTRRSSLHLVMSAINLRFRNWRLDRFQGDTGKART